jgi:hypothetical protein
MALFCLHLVDASIILEEVWLGEKPAFSIKSQAGNGPTGSVPNRQFEKERERTQ